MRDDYERAANAYRDGRVHVLSEQCSTCIFRPGDPMRLRPGRLKDLVDGNLAAGSALVCHATLWSDTVDDALCRGFVDRYADRVDLLQIATRLDLIEYDDPPPEVSP